MCGKTCTWDELREVSKAEAADLPPETWRDGKYDFNDYLIESAPFDTVVEIRERLEGIKLSRPHRP